MEINRDHLDELEVGMDHLDDLAITHGDSAMGTIFRATAFSLDCLREAGELLRPFQTGDRSIREALIAMPLGDAARVRRLLVLGGWLDPWELT